MEIGHAGLHGEVVDEGVGSVGQMEWLGLVMKHRIALPASRSLVPYVQYRVRARCPVTVVRAVRLLAGKGLVAGSKEWSLVASYLLHTSLKVCCTSRYGSCNGTLSEGSAVDNRQVGRTVPGYSRYFEYVKTG